MMKMEEILGRSKVNVKDVMINGVDQKEMNDNMMTVLRND